MTGALPITSFLILIDMIEKDVEVKPMLDEVFRAFEICSETDKKIRTKYGLK